MRHKASAGRWTSSSPFRPRLSFTDQLRKDSANSKSNRKPNTVHRNGVAPVSGRPRLPACDSYIAPAARQPVYLQKWNCEFEIAPLQQGVIRGPRWCRSEGLWGVSLAFGWPQWPAPKDISTAMLLVKSGEKPFVRRSASWCRFSKRLWGTNRTRFVRSAKSFASVYHLRRWPGAARLRSVTWAVRSSP